MAATHVKSVKSSTSSSVPVDTASTSFTAGNLLIAGVGVSDLDTSTVTVTDTTNSRSFTKVDSVAGGGSGIAMAFFYLENATGGSTVVRAAGLTTGQGGTLIVQEWSGFATSGTLDKEVPNNGTAGTSQATGTTAATTQASELALVFGSKNGSTSDSLPSAWTNSYASINDSAADNELDGTNFWYLIAGRKDLSSTGTQQTTYTWVSGFYANVLATFKLSVAGPTILLLNQIPSTLVRM